MATLKHHFLPNRSKSTACLAQEPRTDSMCSPGVYASQPNELDNIFSGKTKLGRRFSKQEKSGVSGLVKRSFSFSRLFRRMAKSPDLIDGNPNCANPYPHGPLALGRIYLTSSINFDSGSWTSLLGDQPPNQSNKNQQTPTQLSAQNIAPRTGHVSDAATLRPNSEHVNIE